MEPSISIPRAALAELLQAAGSPLTPEEYVASLPDVSMYKRYSSRARAAAWSKNTLLVIAVLSVMILPGIWWSFGFHLEDIIIVGGLVAVTCYEYRVHRYFRDLNPAAPSLGFRNQAAFAAAILIYGLYHAFMPGQMDVPREYNNMIDPDTMAQIASLGRLFYLVIGAVGGISQFGLAWYYRTARVAEQV